MKHLLHRRLLLVLLVTAGVRMQAQSFGLFVSTPATAIAVSNQLTYTITVTNLAGRELSDVVVSNVLPPSAVFVSAAPDPSSTYANYGNTTVFYLGLFIPAAKLSMTLTVRPSAAGLFTNKVTIANTNLLDFVPPSSTNLVILATNATPPQADLGVQMSGPPQAVIVNDLLTYGIAATNLGPDAAPDVRLTNSLPPGVILKAVAPAGQPYGLSSSNLTFSLGTLAAGGGTNLLITVQPTNAGVLAFSAAVGAAGVIDTNSANNSASTNFLVINYLSTNLTVSLVSTQKYNPQNGLVEQGILVSNTGPDDVPAARVVGTALTTRLFNASGTNSGSPFVVYSSPLTSGRSVSLLLQFLTGSYFPLTNTQFQAFGVPVPDLTPPAVVSTSTNLDITRLVRLPNGSVLIEFAAVSNRAYTVVYGDDASPSNASIAPPSIIAAGNRLQWIDYGPPTTRNAPTNVNARFYRVLQNP